MSHPVAHAPDRSGGRRRHAARSRQAHAAPLARSGSGTAVENAEIARIFREMADLLELQEANPFRIRAYRNAARTVEELPEPVCQMTREDPEQLTELPGVDNDLAGKIAEIVGTGTLAALHELEAHLPPGITTLMRVPGLGPKRVKALAESLQVRSVVDLERAARSGRVRGVPGFGVKSEQKLLEELRAHRTDEGRMLRSVAAQYAESLAAYVRTVPGVKRVEIAGSYRRCKETVGDIDLLVTGDGGCPVMERFVRHPEVSEVIAHGRTKASVRLRCGLQVDLRLMPEASYGAALYYFTGSKAHNIAVRRMGQARGLKISEYGVFKHGRRIACAEEADVFAAVGLPWIPPELREDRGEIDAARLGQLPRLIELKQVRGDLHAHSTDSDGRDSIEAMAEAAAALGYEYLAITDHSPALRMVRGLDAAGFRRQMRRIDRLNGRLRNMTLLKGAEVDIYPDGTLDLDDSVLEALDVVLVSIHSKFDLPAGQQTERVVRALSHPYVDVFAHPTGRLIGERRGAAFDLEAVFRAAEEHGVMLEINAQPNRLDLDDLAARAATARNLMLSVGTDAHALPELRFMRWGVDQARRGWVPAAMVANARSLSGLTRLLHVCRNG